MYTTIENLGWTLLHFIWQGAAVGALFALLMHALARASAELRYVVGLGCLMLLAAAPAATFWTLSQPLAGAAPGAAAELLATTMAVSHVDADRWVQFGLWLESLLPWAVVGWLAGVGVLSVRLVRDWRNVRRLVRHGVRLLPAEWNARVAALRATLGVGDRVVVLESMLVKVPMLIGWIKPVVLIPSSALIGLTPRQLELIIAHELAHIRRYDYLINLFQIVLETLFFYHPVVRWMSSRIRAERENCCDDTVVACCGDTLTYARALTEMETLRFLPTRMGIAASGGHLLGRINRLVHLDRRQRGSAHWLVGVLLGMTALALVGGTHLVLDEEPATAAAPAGTTGTELVLPDPQPLERLAPVTPDREGDAAAGEVLEEIVPPAVPSRERPVAGPAAAAAGSAQIERLPVTESVARQVDRQPQPVPVAPPPSTATDADSAAPQTRPAADVQLAAIVQLPQRRPELPPVAQPAANEAAGQTAELPAAQTAAASRPGGVLIEGRQPAYPFRARYRGLEGFVTVSFTVTRDGSVADIHVIDSKRGSQFNRAAMSAVKTWKFEPFLVDGTPVERVLTHTIEFKLDDSAPVNVGGDSCEMTTGSRICRTLPEAETAQPRAQDR